jgi:hypothetical protein
MAAYGLKPVQRVDGMPYAGATRLYKIDPAGEATNLFYGQVVNIGADGYIALATATGADATTNNLGGSGVGAIGVFVGCEYVNAQGQVIYDQYYPSGTANGGDIVAYVVDDPNALFQAELDETATQTMVGTNTTFATAQTTSTGSTTTGVSNSQLDATVATTAKAFKIVALAPDVSTAAVLVKFNPSFHRFTSDAGL